MAAKHQLVVVLQVRCLQIVRREPPHTLLTGKLTAGPGSGSRGGFSADAVVPGPAGRFSDGRRPHLQIRASSCNHPAFDGTALPGTCPGLPAGRAVVVSSAADGASATAAVLRRRLLAMVLRLGLCCFSSRARSAGPAGGLRRPGATPRLPSPNPRPRRGAP